MNADSASNERIVVGMSGGVDSSVTAWLLNARGFDVHGVFMFNWDEDEQGYCTAADDFQDARKVCEELGIPLHRVNFAREYRDQVFAQFLKDLENGMTPNPDVLCNREIKFGSFLDYARRLGATRIATGHYARIDHTGPVPRLLRGIDHNKDQSYFLHAVSAPALANTIFPLGELTKTRVRELAMQAGLHNCRKRDSTGICFIGERPFRSFLQQYLPREPGPMQTTDGDVVGQHQGLAFYTLGQRQGLGIGGVAGTESAPWYVVAKNPDNNALIVGQGHDHPLLYSNWLEAGQMHWIDGGNASGVFQCQVATRYRQAPAVAQLCIDPSRPGRCRIEFEQPQWAVTPGQYAVVYDGDVCLGGATIVNTGQVWPADTAAV